MEKQNFVYQPREHIFKANELEEAQKEGWQAFLELVEEFDELRKTGERKPFLSFVLDNGTVQKENGSYSPGAYRYLVTSVVRPYAIGMIPVVDMARTQHKGGSLYEWFALSWRAFCLSKPDEAEELKKKFIEP